MAAQIVGGEPGLIGRRWRPMIGRNGAAELASEHLLPQRVSDVLDGAQSAVDDAC